MKRLLFAAAIAVSATAAFPTVAGAISTGTPGQPSQSCQSFFGDSGPFTPNGFNTTGFNHATTVYAGAGNPQSHNSVNPKSVSQYDVACFQAANRP
jgi:hypothetical protein